MKCAEIIAVGSELLTPFRLDTNSLFLTDELNKLGVAVVRKTVVGDDRASLREAFRQALEHSDLVIATGGLGPTEDDVTREVLADIAGRPLLANEQVLQQIRVRFSRLGRTMTPNNERQALVPEGARVLPNSFGTAPGLWLEIGSRVVLLMPGPPGELHRIFEEQVKPLLECRASPQRMVHRVLRVAGMAESSIDHRISEIYKRYENVETTVLASPEGIEVHFTLWSKDRAGAEAVIGDLCDRVETALGDAVFSTRGETLDEVVARELRIRGTTIAVAESCTGGQVSARLTSIPDSSKFFLGGVVAYSDEMKAAWIGVPAGIIEAHGAVSSAVAVAMAEGVRRSAGATLGLGITGFAGPGGGTTEKPVGTVHISLADGAGAREQVFHFLGDRERIRLLASQTALDILRRYLLRVPKGRG